MVTNDFYHETFIFKETDKDVRDLVASPFTIRIRDYDMPDVIKVPTNLHFFTSRYAKRRDSGRTTLHPEALMASTNESLKDYVARFSKETLHMADRSDVMVSGAFISGLRPGHLFKDLIAKPPSSLEDLFTQTNNFIRTEDANNENHLREPRRETK
ncbi:hypothetical protein Tco_0443214 [Tanacetum coccineum]